MEIRDVPGYPGYRVSSTGIVYGPDGVLNQTVSKRHNKHNTRIYKHVHLPRKNISVHRIMAMAFLDFDERLVVNHINGISSDNRTENLELVTSGQNSIHAIVTGLKDTKITREKLILIREALDAKESIQSLARQHGVTVSTIRKIKKGKKYCWEL